MAHVARLAELIERLSELDSEDTIYVVEPWSEQSEAIVTREPETGGLPAEASDAGMTYFLEVCIAQEFVQDWLKSSKKPPMPAVTCKRLIQYAINDA